LLCPAVANHCSSLRSCLQEAGHTAAAAYTHIPTLKEGEKIKITIGGRGKHNTTHDANNGVHSNSATGAPTSVATASHTGTGPSKGFGGLLKPGSVVQ
jgi:N6-adenosine-specific RNA methylase IME4